MKKFLNKFVVILILITMGLEVVLPKNIYADTNNVGETINIDSVEFKENYEVIRCAWTIWYVLYPNYHTEGTSADKTKKIFYIDSNGNKAYPKTRENMFSEIEYEILEGITYYVHKNDYGGVEQRLIDLSGCEEFIPDSTGWYAFVSANKNNTIDGSINPVDDSLKTAIYFDDTGNWHWVDIEKVDGFEPRAYLTRGTVYYVYKDVAVYKTARSLFEALKNLIANFIFSIANGLHYLVGYALGETITIDDLVFNNYSETNISYFDKQSEVENPSSLIYGANGVGGLDSVVNKWYSIFMKIALMGYMVILVYMGIKILINSTAEKKANYKKLFVDWIIGLAILLLFPYAMKYMIKINESFVEVIEINKGYEDIKSSELEQEKYDEDLLKLPIDDAINWAAGEDYMSKIAYAAYELQEPALSLAFMIMTWQLIALLFHYYKRLFMIAFLIIIFPLVGLSYAIDKIADGKSQAFNTWAKEFMINVFVQTFHAIVYVFACSTIYSSVGIKDTGIGYDYILIIIGVTFLFSGESIIRQIFGQVSNAGTMKSLSDSAVATFAKFKLAENLVKKAGEYTIGEKSIPYKLKRGTNKIRAINARMNAFDKTATADQAYNIGMRLEHAPEEPGESASEEEKRNFLKERAIYNAAAVFNNPNSHSQLEKAKALDTLKKVANENPDHDVFKDTKATAGQIAAMADLDYDIQGMLGSGMNRLDIERQVTARLGIIFPADSDEKINDRKNTYYTSLHLNGVNNSVSKGKIRRDVEIIKRELHDIDNSFVFGEDGSEHDDTSEDLYRRYEDRVTDELESVVREYARYIDMLNNRHLGIYSKEELLRAAQYVRQHEYYDEVTLDMVEELGVDIDIVTHSLAKKILKESDLSSELKEMAEEEVADYENNPRKGYFEDELPIHEILKEAENDEQLDRIIEEVYESKKRTMKDATEKLGKDYLLENNVDVIQGSYDTSRKTQDGYTKEELLAMKVDAIGKTLSDLAAVNKSNASENSGAAGILGWIMKEYLAKKEEERTGISRSIEERRNVYDPTVSTKDYIEKNKAERDRIQNEHFMGDIGDRKDK